MNPIQAEIYGPPLPPIISKVTLMEAAELTSVNYHTMNSAHHAARLGISKESTGDGERLLVAVEELVRYMCEDAPEPDRWPEFSVSVSEITTCEALYQLRSNPDSPAGRAKVKAIAQAFATGEKVAAVLVFTGEDGSFHLIDGHHRLKGAIRAGRSTIRAIVVKLPTILGRGIADGINAKHGDNVTDRDKYPRVIEHLRRHPADLQQLAAHELNGVQYAKELKCSPSMLCRAIGELVPREANLPDLVQILKALQVYFAGQDFDTSSELDNRIAAVLTAKAIRATLPPKSEASPIIKAHISARSSPASRRAPALLLALQDRRGGDRRRIV